MTPFALGYVLEGHVRGFRVSHDGHPSSVFEYRLNQFSSFDDARAYIDSQCDMLTQVDEISPDVFTGRRMDSKKAIERMFDELDVCWVYVVTVDGTVDYGKPGLFRNEPLSGVGDDSWD